MFDRLLGKRVVSLGMLGVLVGFMSARAMATDPPAVRPPEIQITPPIDPGGIVPPHLRDKKKPKPGPKADAKLPKWLKKRIADFKTRAAGKTKQFPPVYTYKYKGKLVYFYQLGQMPVVHSADGDLLGMPWGGFTGKGDGKLPDFREKATDKKLVWKDPAAGDKEVNHYRQRIKRIEKSMGAAQALKSVNHWLKHGGAKNPAVRKLLEAEKKRLETAKKPG